MPVGKRFTLDLNVCYYQFNLPSDIGLAPFTGNLTFTLYADGQKFNSPTVYSYVLFNGQMSYYTNGTFETTDTLSLPERWSFDKVKLSATGSLSSTDGYSTSFEAFDFGTTSPIALSIGNEVSLGKSTQSLKLRGTLTTTLPQTLTPKISSVTLMAVGQKPLTLKLDSSSTQDYVEGSGSMLIDRTNLVTAQYELDNSQTFDVTKLPLLQVWVKPLTTNAQVAFAVWDMTEARYERVTSDRNKDGLFKVGEDLVYNTWNLLLLDLRFTAGSGIAKDAKGFKVEVGGGSKVLLDNVSALPTNDAVYEYDAAGNRKSYTENGKVTSYAYYPGTNRLMQKSGPDGTTNYLYDNNGNLTQQRIESADCVSTCYDYAFNELNQLVKVNKNGKLIAEYFYDEKGLRYKKVDYLASDTKTTIYVYGQGAEPMYEEVYSSANLMAPASSVSYLNMGAKRLGRLENGAMKYYFTDHLGSTRIVMDSTGKCTYQDYDPFGGVFGAKSDEQYKFNGKEEDDVTGLYYYNARYYDPTIGRFISEDPAKDGVNWYQYCENNPLKYIDRTGLATTFTYYDPIFNRKVDMTISINAYVNRSIDKQGESNLNTYVNTGLKYNGSKLSNVAAGTGILLNAFSAVRLMEKFNPELFVIGLSLDAIAWLNSQQENHKQEAFDYEKGIMTDVKDQCKLAPISLFEINLKTVTSEKMDNQWVPILKDCATGYLVRYGINQKGFVSVDSFKELLKDR